MEYNASLEDKSISRDKLPIINQLSYKFQIYFQYVLIKLTKPLSFRERYTASVVIALENYCGDVEIFSRYSYLSKIKRLKVFFSLTYTNDEEKIFTLVLFMNNFINNI